ncbi:hypothetical protein BKA67DRAFT_658253 [Truncatella angustata]|uniref:Polyprenal reductase n=1 Tax=Truncatella angustata TaxID=152316 RepID=A0A9P8ZXE6_9PEZI|nr:uncharacterized protein BKA67DRAFT_658253 [Truncatella angustata]KAH6653914.1 hypothetical protein BKA67DRAFT_658253 [Truncatella angustata]
MVSIWSVFQSLDPFLEPAHICQTFFILAASAVLAVAATPRSARGLLTQYGARSSSPPRKDGPGGNAAGDRFTDFISWVTSIGNVPHSWFIHFYVLSVTSSVFWAAQYFLHGSILDAVAQIQGTWSSSPSMTIHQVQLAWLLMALQGARRLSECLFVMRSSSSRMWVVHWLLGCAYYLCMGVAVWVEGSDAILRSDRSSHLGWPSVKELIGLSSFLLAWSMQHRCHKHLSDLAKYSLPNRGMFRYLICPHYTCECLLYLSLAIVAAPEKQLFNKTLLCGSIFVATNLGVTAAGTRNWYAGKFGEEMIIDKWNMIPLIY